MLSKITAPLHDVWQTALEKHAVLRRVAEVLNEKLGGDKYDLPLHKDADTRFLILLVALMSFLAVLAFAGSLSLSAMTARWSSGLENKITIEVPVETPEGDLLSQTTVKKETQKVQNGLKNNPIIRNSKILSDSEIQELIAPWIGNNLTMDEIPLPGLISVELAASTPDALERLKHDVAGYSRYAVIETHQEWLRDLTTFARTLQTLALIVALLIGAATITAIASAIRSRMTIHKNEVELLHLMGATDHYIARQFQRHALIITFKGAVLGTLCGAVITGLIILMSYQSRNTLIPAIHLDLRAVMLLLSVPFVTLLISGLCARFTVLRTLAKMP